MHNCKSCGFPLSSDDKICKNCGYKVSNKKKRVPIDLSKKIVVTPFNSMYKLAILLVFIAIIMILSATYILSRESKNSTKETDNLEVVKQTYKFKYSGYKFDIPTTMNYDINNNILYLSDSKGKWENEILLNNGSFERLLENRNVFNVVMSEAGYTASEAILQSIYDKDYITMELSYGGDNLVFAITQVSPNVYMTMMIRNINNKFDYDVLNEMTAIINNLEEESDNINMIKPVNIDISKILELAK